MNVSKPVLTAKDFLGDTLLVMSSETSRKRRRRFGLFCLGLAGLMLLLGQTVFRPYLDGWGFILYWMGCFLFTGWAVITALLDLRAVQRETRQEQREILHDLVEEIKKEEPANASEQSKKQQENRSRKRVE